MVDDAERILADRKKRTPLIDLEPTTDAVMLHYVMNALYVQFLKQHRLREDWQQTLIMSARKYLGSLPDAQVKLISQGATNKAQVVFGPCLNTLIGIDIRHVVVAFAQVILTLVDQHRYRFADDALVLQSLGIVTEAVDEQVADWAYERAAVRYLYDDLMRRVDGSGHFRRESDHDATGIFDTLKNS